MLRRKFGKTNEDVSILGFGAMRLPTVNGVSADIDEERAIAMIRSAIDRGVNYIDTAYPYHGTSMGEGGNSEPLVAKALQNGYRERAKIATKLPSWLIQSRDDMDRYLNEQLQRLETESIDFYLIHALNKNLWKTLVDAGVRDFLDNAISDGRIKHAGFSFHDDQATFLKIVDDYDWSFCMFQYSYLDESYQAGRKGLEYAAQKGLGIAIMEPLRGGVLAHGLPQRVIDIFDGAVRKRTPVEWALRWVWNHPEVGVVLSGMSTEEHVTQNIQAASNAHPDSLSRDDLERFEDIKKIFSETTQVLCTACGYCLPCPEGVSIPNNFSAYNNYFLMDGADTEEQHHATARIHYNFGLRPEEKADVCIQCGHCETLCPQGIKIGEELKRVSELFHTESGN